MDPKGKVALVTGAVQGLGLAITKELLKQGVKSVSMCDVNHTKGQTVVEQLKEEFGKERVIFIKTDVTNNNEFEDAFKKTLEEFCGLDIVVNNAGICSDKNWQRQVDVNLNGVIRGSLMALKYMGEDQGGKGGIVINISSAAALAPASAIPLYTTTKYGVLGLSRTLGSEYFWKMTKVRVTTICPGNTSTELTESIVSKSEIPTYRDEWMPQLLKEIEDYGPWQKSQNVGAGVLQIIREGRSGSIWICKHDKTAYEVNIPPHQELRI